MRTTRYALPAQCLIGLFIMVNLSLAQSGDQKIQIQIENDNGASAVMSFGNNPQATYGIDHDLGEMEGPPLSPAFDVRWVNNPGRPDPSYGMGLLYNDYVPCPVNPARADTFVLLVSDGMETSKKWTLSWPDSEYLKTVADSMLLFDPYHREMLVNMFRQTSYVVLNSEGPVRYRIYKYGRCPCILAGNFSAHPSITLILTGRLSPGPR